MCHISLKCKLYRNKKNYFNGLAVIVLKCVSTPNLESTLAFWVVANSINLFRISSYNKLLDYLKCRNLFSTIKVEA